MTDRVRIPDWENNPRRPVYLAELCLMLGRKKRTVWRYVKKGLLPRPVRLPSGTFWLLRDIDEFIEKAREGRP